MPLGGGGGGAGGSGTGPIPSITGCFAWYVGDYIATVATGVVTYWFDQSGSGNHLVFAGTSGTSLPIYISGNNLFNHHNTVRFSGVANYLTTNSNNASLNFSPSSVTMFTVYSTPIANTVQTLFSIDNSIDRKSSLAITLNTIQPDTLSQSGWSFAWGKGGPLSNNGWFSLSAGSPVQPLNALTIRHDRFRTDNVFAFGYFGVDVATGIANTQVSTNNFLNIARDSTFNNNFVGDVAEVIGYNHKLTDTEVASVYSYLATKYISSSPVPPPFFQPDSIAGLFGWYRSTSIGITGIDGSTVQYWPDDSTLGNNVSINLGQSGTWIMPKFYRKQVNGYPTVRFANGPNFNYLYNNLVGNQLDFASQELTTFSVFKSTDTVDTQSIYGITYQYGQIIANIGLNKNHNNSFFFSYGDISDNEYYVEASSVHFGYTMYGSQDFIIRHDRFRQSDGTFMFGRYGADVGSGISNTYNNSPRVISIGDCYSQNRPFIGDIAEIINYNRRLSDFEVEEINTYLIQKYLPPNVGVSTLFTWSDNPTGIYKGASLYTNATNPIKSGSKTLYTGSSRLSLSGVSLYEISKGSSTLGTTLYIQAGSQQFPPLSLYTHGINTNSSGLPLYIGSSRFASNSCTLYISGHPIINVGIPLYISANAHQFPPLTLFTKAANFSHNSIYLSTIGLSHPSKTGALPLYIGNTLSPGFTGSGLYAGKPLYLEGGRFSTSMNLFMAGPAINYHPSGWMPLYVAGPITTGMIMHNVSLFLSNNYSVINSRGKKLFTAGAGGLAGGLPAKAGMPLVIGRGSGLTASKPLFVAGKMNAISGVSLSVSGVNSTSHSTTLFIMGTGLQHSTTLYIGGPTSSGNHFSLFTNGLPSLNNSLNLFHHGF